jgi:Tfp pilus assembly protein PilN
MKAVNLIPSEQRSGGSVGARSEGAAFAVLGLLAGLAILTLLYGLAHHQLASRRAEAATLTAHAQEVQAQAAQLTPYASFMAMREQRLQAISQLIGSRFDWATAMGELSRVLPSDVSLSSLQGAVGSQTGSLGSKSSSSAGATTGAAGATGTSVSSATPPGTTPTFTLAGCATSQAVVAQMLVRLRLVSGVSAATLQSSTKSDSSGGSSGASCPTGDPVFSVEVAFQPLPAAPATSTEALLSSASASSANGGGGSHQSNVSSASAGANR